MPCPSACKRKGLNSIGVRPQSSLIIPCYIKKLHSTILAKFGNNSTQFLMVIAMLFIKIFDSCSGKTIYHEKAGQTTPLLCSMSANPPLSNRLTRRLAIFTLNMTTLHTANQTQFFATHLQNKMATLSC